MTNSCIINDACSYPRCECMHGPEDCVFLAKNRKPKPVRREEAKKQIRAAGIPAAQEIKDTI